MWQGSPLTLEALRPQILSRTPVIGLDSRCRMAISFGFEADKCDVPVKIGERVLLPAVRQASADTLIITNGFSCFEQIEGLTGRRPLHITEVLQMAIGEADQNTLAANQRELMQI